MYTCTYQQGQLAVHHGKLTEHYKPAIMDKIKIIIKKKKKPDLRMIKTRM